MLSNVQIPFLAKGGIVIFEDTFISLPGRDLLHGPLHYLLCDRQRRVRGLVLLASRFLFVYVETYTNGNFDPNKTKPRTRRCP